MKKRLLNLSGKIDGDIIDILHIITDVADKLKIPFFVVGATARYMIIHIGYGIESERATIDLDIGVQVESWEAFKELKSSLVGTDKFQKDREPQRLKFKNYFPLDLVPFGLISKGNNCISWPPKHEFSMSIIGFKEALDNSILVRLSNDPQVEIKFASLCGIAVLKIISWNEKYPERAKDAKDLDYIMRNYVYAGNEDRLYDKEVDLLEVDGFEYEYASAQLLGRDMAKMLKVATKERILDILKQQTGNQERYRLVEDMIENYSLFEEKFEMKLQMLEHLQKGIREG
jgi:predicted nucleotidyltransferase